MKHTPLLVRLLLICATLSLAACETSLNAARAQRFGQSPRPAAPVVEPRALALALQLTADGNALSRESLADANALLRSQGRIESQVLTITPLSERGERMAARLATALARAGARAPRVEARSQDTQRLAQAQDNGWDLELQSEAIVVDTARCGIADPQSWSIHPYYGVGAMGCASRSNVARMVSDPRDLVRARTLGGADGAAAALAVQRYQTGEIRDLIDIDFDE